MLVLLPGLDGTDVPFRPFVEALPSWLAPRVEERSTSTMDKKQMQSRREYFDMVHGVTVRAIGALADSELDFRPKPGMRTPRELVFHIYAQEKALAESAREGRMSMESANASNPEDAGSAAALKGLATVRDAVAFANGCHAA